MKKLTRAMVSTISASISWLTFGTTGSGVPSLPIARTQQYPGKGAFLLS
jgi:hypothetical protein